MDRLGIWLVGLQVWVGVWGQKIWVGDGENRLGVSTDLWGGVTPTGLLGGIDHGLLFSGIPEYSKTGDKLQLLPSLRQQSSVDHLVVSGGNLSLATFNSDSIGRLSMNFTMLRNLNTPGFASPLCSNLLLSGDRVYIFCKEASPTNSSEFRLKLYGFSKTDYNKADDQFMEMTTFYYPTTPEKRLEATLCAYKDGVTWQEYIAVYELAETTAQSSDPVFVFTLIDRKFKAFSISLRAQVLGTYSRLLSVGCSFNTQDGERYLFIVHTDLIRTSIVPISGGLWRQYITSANYIPGAKPSQYSLGLGILLPSRPVIASTNNLLWMHINSGVLRILRAPLVYIPLESATGASQFVMDLNSASIELLRRPCPIGVTFQSYRFVEQISTLIHALEVKADDNNYPRILFLFQNNDMKGTFGLTSTVFSRYESFLVTVNSNPGSVFQQVHLVTSVSVTPFPSNLARVINVTSASLLSSISYSIRTQKMPVTVFLSRIRLRR